MTAKPYKMSLKDFKDLIFRDFEGLSDEKTMITFGGGDLSFYRVKWTDDHVANIQFNQVYTVSIDPEQD